MSDSSPNPLDQPWEDATVTLVYRDGDKIETRPSERAVRTEVEAEKRAGYLEQARASGDPRAIEAAEGFTLSAEEFQHLLTYNAERMLAAPLYLRGESADEFRLLPPWAILEIRIQVNRPTSRIVRP